MNNQSGAALLAFVMILVVASSLLLLKALHNSSIERDKITTTVLAQAKDALIGRAVMDSERPGRLPCPDTNNDGSAEAFVDNTCPSYSGRLPWKSLGLPELLDASGQRLWYALSPALSNNLVQPVNSLTVGDLTVGEQSPLAAIILAPGPPLAGQTARPSNSIADYLDDSNADGDSIYTAGPATNLFNDRLLTISTNDLFRVVSKRVAAEVRGNSAGGLCQYYANSINHVYPWAAAGVDGVLPTSSTLFGFVPFTALTYSPESLAWLTNNKWFERITYAVAPDQAKATLTVPPGTPVELSVAVCPP